MAKNDLNQWEQVFKDYGYESQFIPFSDQIPLEHLEVLISPDYASRPRVLYIHEDKQSITLPEELSSKIQTESLVQIGLTLPFTVKDEAVWEVARYLMFINKSLPTPGLILDEVSRKVLFRYTLIKPDSVIPAETLLAIVGAVTLWLDTFAETIEKVAQGQSMNEVIDLLTRNVA